VLHELDRRFANGIQGKIADAGRSLGESGSLDLHLLLLALLLGLFLRLSLPDQFKKKGSLLRNSFSQVLLKVLRAVFLAFYGYFLRQSDRCEVGLVPLVLSLFCQGLQLLSFALKRKFVQLLSQDQQPFAQFVGTQVLSGLKRYLGLPEGFKFHLETFLQLTLQGMLDLSNLTVSFPFPTQISYERIVVVRN